MSARCHGQPSPGPLDPAVAELRPQNSGDTTKHIMPLTLLEGTTVCGAAVNISTPPETPPDTGGVWRRLSDSKVTVMTERQWRG